MELVVLTRQELFDLVWTIPVQKLASRYGITDVALKKRCKKHGIPTPGVGYWARVASGQKLKRPALPKSPAPNLDRVVFKPAAPLKSPEPVIEVPSVSMPTKLVEPHEATLWAEQQLQEARTDAYGRLEVGGSYRPDLCVRPETAKRALLILDTIVKALAARGLQVEAAPYHATAASTIIVGASGERLVLQLEERLAKGPHVMTPAEAKAAAQTWGRKPPKWDYVPEGRLSVRLYHTHYLFKGRAHWTETKATALEQQLGRIVVGIEFAVAAHKEIRAEEERQKAQRLADERVRLRPERLQWYQAWMARDLNGQAASWARARQLREFLTAYESTKKPAGAAVQWLAAARHYADRLDPLTNGVTVEHELEPTDVVVERLIQEERRRES